MWPQVQRYGWIRLVPATALVLQPMNVGAWIDAQVDFPVARSAPQSELGRRLNEGELWAWQEWVLFKRVERSCRARDDDSMAPVRLDTARGDERSRGRPATASALIYDPSFLGGSPEEAEGLLELIEGLAAPESWIDNGGSVGGALSISGRVVVVAPARVHLEIEALLAGLEEAIAAGPPPPIPCELPENPRAFRIDCECGAGLLDNIRAARAMSSASLRSAGPTLDDGVTGDELDACRRAAFGLLDAIR
jgi:hypothetical protein